MRFSKSDRYKVKICGITNLPDAACAVDCGADYLGMIVEIPESSRTLPRKQAAELRRQIKAPLFLLIRNRTEEEAIEIYNTVRPYGLHLVGEEPPQFVKNVKTALSCVIWKTLHLPAMGQKEVDLDELKHLADDYADAGADALVLDAVDYTGAVAKAGGTGKVMDWTYARELIAHAKVPVFLAGGICPENVAEAISATRPYGVDLASGVEKSKGIKDPDKMRKLFDEIRKCAGIQ